MLDSRPGLHALQLLYGALQFNKSPSVIFTLFPNSCPAPSENRAPARDDLSRLSAGIAAL